MCACKPVVDRYTSFSGIDCDGHSRQMMQHLDRAIAMGGNRWIMYFEKKIAEKNKMGQDDLYFVGSQMNSLRSFMEEIEDKEGAALLEHIEENCC